MQRDNSAGQSACRVLPPARPPFAPPRPWRRATWRALLVSAVVIAGTAPVLTAPDSASAAGGRPGGPLVPESGFYVGAYTKHADGYSADKQKQAIYDLETRLGRRLHIDHQFYSWEDSFPTWREPWDLANDRIPMISWNGTNTAAIVAGGYDGMILKRAEGIRALGQPVFLRWFWEMDGNHHADWAISPQSYVAAWRHIHDLFAATGTTNAVWAWCPNASAFTDGSAMAYYPGDGYVDWVCADGYNWAPNRPGDRWRNFGEIFDGFYAAGRKLNKPLMIAETGALERNPDEKAQWLHEAHDTIVARYPAIAALVYFNADSTEKGIDFAWDIDTSESAFEGFRYLFTGPAPIPPPADPMGPPPEGGLVAPNTATDPGLAAAPSIGKRTPSPSVAGVPPSPSLGSSDAGTKGKPTAGSTGALKEPSARLTWVLQLLRQLESESVPAPARVGAITASSGAGRVRGGS